jgi:O-antigen/teichoic acid export membrane protein
MARDSALKLGGTIFAGVVGFLTIVVITRGLHARGAGAFFEGTALFVILATTAALGADTALLRFVARRRALAQHRDLRRTVGIGVGPVLVLGAVAAVVLWVYAPQLAHLLSHGRDPEAIVPYIRVLAPFLPFSAAESVAIAGVRGFGAMRPYVVLENVGKPVARLIFSSVVVGMGLGSVALGLGWGIPLVLELVAAMAVIEMRIQRDHRRLARRARRRTGSAPLSGDADAGAGDHGWKPTTAVASEFWRFATPRAFASVFATLTTYLDTLLIGTLGSVRQAGIYAAAGRYMIVGRFALAAVVVIIPPYLAASLAQGERGRTRQVYQTATWWLMIPSWPVYLSMALFAPLLLSAFGREFVGGQFVLMVLSLSMLISMATGPVTILLLMAGKSGLNLLNTAIGLALNLGLNLWLIPRYGIDGAAIAWGASILTNNLMALVEATVFLKMDPFGRGFPVVALAAGLSYGGVGMLVRLTLGASVGAFVLFGVVATGLYLLALRRFRKDLALDELTDAFLRRTRTGRRRGPGRDPDQDPDHISRRPSNA